MNLLGGWGGLPNRVVIYWVFFLLPGGMFIPPEQGMSIDCYLQCDS